MSPAELAADFDREAGAERKAGERALAIENQRAARELEPRSARAGTLLPSARPLPTERHPFQLPDYPVMECAVCGQRFTKNAAHFDGAIPVSSPDVTEPDPTPTGRTQTYTVAELAADIEGAAETLHWVLTALGPDHSIGGNEDGSGTLYCPLADESR